MYEVYIYAADDEELIGTVISAHKDYNAAMCAAQWHNEEGDLLYYRTGIYVNHSIRMQEVAHVCRDQDLQPSRRD